MEAGSASSDERAKTELTITTRYSGNGVPTQGVDVSAIHPLRKDAFLQRGCQGDSSTQCHTCGCACLRYESYCCGDSMPSRDSRRRRNGRLSLGIRTKESTAGDGTRIGLSHRRLHFTQTPLEKTALAFIGDQLQGARIA